MTKQIEVKHDDGTKTKILVLGINDVIQADWNYKESGSDEDIDKLIASINRDGSAGVLAVREIEIDGKSFFEAIDGNHRHEALKRMGRKKVVVENFGPISLAESVTIARRRNHKWFDDDIVKLSKLLSEVVLPEIPMDELIGFMPDTQSELENMLKLSAFSWDDFNNVTSDDNADDSSSMTAYESSESDYVELKIKLPRHLFEQYQNFKKTCDLSSDYLAIENLLKNQSLVNETSE